MPEIEYFYSAHSAYAYLGSARYAEIARAANRRIAHKPMDLRKVVAVTGPGSTSGRAPPAAQLLLWPRDRALGGISLCPRHAGFPNPS